MKVPTVLTAVIAVLAFTKTVNCFNNSSLLKFPDGFLFGASSAAYQVEGAWNASGRGESIWDYYTHTYPERIADRSNGDVACDSYHKYKDDVQLLKFMGMNHYRLSLSWTRILPTGFSNQVSAAGIQYYKDLLDELNANGIQPFVTIHHWDHPQVLEDMGGWTNEKIVDFFVDYADVVFRELGSRIKVYNTINEPYQLCTAGYFDGSLAPGKKLGLYGTYLCMHNVLKAHARVYHLYDKKYRTSQNGKIGIALACANAYSNTTVLEDTFFESICGWIANPIFKGDYPEVVKRVIADFEGRKALRMPKFNKAWINYIKGTWDYFGLNYYTSFLVNPTTKRNDTDLASLFGLETSFDPSWPTTGFSQFRVVPQGLRGLLNKIKNKYINPPVLILENGITDFDELLDRSHLKFFYLHLQEMLKAIYLDGCDVRGFTVWSLLDDFEWTNGYNFKFGLVQVDFNDPNRRRSLRLSSLWFRELIQERRLINYEGFLGTK